MNRCLPLKADHPAVGEPCGLCEKPFVPGDVIEIVSIGPVTPGNLRKMLQSRAYNAQGKLCHADCVDAAVSPAAHGGKEVKP